jgi:hypothetical protein
MPSTASTIRQTIDNKALGPVFLLSADNELRISLSAHLYQAYTVQKHFQGLPGPVKQAHEYNPSFAMRAIRTCKTVPHRCNLGLKTHIHVGYGVLSISFVLLAII